MLIEEFVVVLSSWFFCLSCLARPSSQWPAQAALTEKSWTENNNKFFYQHTTVPYTCASLKSTFINAKILILSYKISILALMKIVLERRYLEMIVPLNQHFMKFFNGTEWIDIAIFFEFIANCVCICPATKKSLTKNIEQ